MVKTKIIIVEDENIVAKDIQLILKKLGYNVVGSCATGEKAIELAKETKPDLILMDIILKSEMDGIEAAEIINKERKVPIIYLTANADEKTLSKAKLTQPYAYIIKPFKEIDIRTSIEMAMYKSGKESELMKERDLLYSLAEDKSEKGYIFVKSRLKYFKLDTKNILFIEALKDYVAFNTTEEKYIVHSTMKKMAKNLSSNEFIRIHRSYIVRIDKIKSIDLPKLIIENVGKQFPIGASFKDQLLKEINYL